MANKTVDHKERTREMRAISLGLFARHGLDDVNFGMIAEACDDLVCRRSDWGVPIARGAATVV